MTLLLYTITPSLGLLRNYIKYKRVKITNKYEKNNLNKNIFKDFKSILNLKKLNQDINFIANFGRDVEYYT